MSSTANEAATYEVRVRGRLSESWSDWLNGVTVSFKEGPNGPETTILTGHLDQSALRGLVTRLWDLNLTVECMVQLDRYEGDSRRKIATGAT